VNAGSIPREAIWDYACITVMRWRRFNSLSSQLTRKPPTCHIEYVTAFNFKLQRGMPIFEQVVFASIGAMLRGEFKAGQPFPSIRSLASDLKIHPNTAHKVIQFLVEDRWLEARPGVGTVVASRPKTRGEDARRLIRDDVHKVIAKARSIEVGLQDVKDELTQQWSRLDPIRED
jgi:GntR family transcriptional regulator